MMSYSRGEPASRAGLVATAVVKRIARLPRSHHLKLTSLAPTGQDATNIIYVGEGECLDYLAHLHASIARPLHPQTLALTRLPDFIRSRGANTLMYVEVNRLLEGLLPRSAPRTHPWISQSIALPRHHTASSEARESACRRKIRKHSLAGHLSLNPDDVVAFHRDFYVPYLRWRFGEVAHARSLDELQSVVRSGFLLRITAGDRMISGVLCRLTRSEVTTVAYGLAPPYDENLRMGGLSTASHMVIGLAEDRSLRRVNLLRSRPNLRDGVFENKRRLGGEPFWDPWPHTVIAILPPTATTLPAASGHILVRAGSTDTSAAPLSILMQERGETRPTR